MKLKTLKDLEKFEDLKLQDHFIVSSAVLKQEAIKWVKRHQVMAMDTKLTEDFIKHFFNITEDDLKSPEGEE